jgi:hypothetical protein
MGRLCAAFGGEFVSPEQIDGYHLGDMALVDVNSANDLAKGQAKAAAQAAVANSAQVDAAPAVAGFVAVPPSVQQAQMRRQARAREATVAGWLRRLSV